MKQWKNELEMYITGIVQNHNHKLLAVSCMPDHIHIFLGYNVNHLIPDLVEEIKTSSNAWIKQMQYSKFRFAWQRGYGAFTHSHSAIDRVVKYIANQEAHHRKKTFRNEYRAMLDKYEIEFNAKYLFNFYDDISSRE